MKRFTSVTAALVPLFAALIALPAAPAAAAAPPSCLSWKPLADNGYPVTTEINWPDNGSKGVLRARPRPETEPQYTATYETCLQGTYSLIRSKQTGLYLTVETGWTGSYYGTIVARVPASQVGINERFHFTCYPTNSGNPIQRPYCIFWAEANHLYVTSEGGISNTNDPYFGILRARTAGANVGHWELFYES